MGSEVRNQDRSTAAPAFQNASTTVVTDANGDAVFERAYDPWGNVRIATGTADTDRLYTGQRFDAATGLYYVCDADRARYRACPESYRRNPTLARFISADTIVANAGDPQSWNRYAYVLGNPLRYTDPSGHCIAPVYDGFGEFYGDYDVTRDDPLDCTTDEYDAFSFEFSKFWANIVTNTPWWESHTQVSDILYWLSVKGRTGDLSLFYGSALPDVSAGCVAIGPRNFSCPTEPEPEKTGGSSLSAGEIATGAGLVIIGAIALPAGVGFVAVGAFSLNPASVYYGIVIAEGGFVSLVCGFYVFDNNTNACGTPFLQP